MRRQLLPALRMMLVMTFLCGILYTSAVTLFAQALLPERADGSLVMVGGELVGSELLGQRFQAPEYFHSRPSAVSYDPRLSGASNYGPNNPEHLASVSVRAEEFRQMNGLESDEPVPVDAVTASGSGLDPHISVANARLQAPRVARERRVSLAEVMALIDEHASSGAMTQLPDWSVNVLLLNKALDER